MAEQWCRKKCENCREYFNRVRRNQPLCDVCHAMDTMTCRKCNNVRAKRAGNICKACSSKTLISKRPKIDCVLCGRYRKVHNLKRQLCASCYSNRRDEWINICLPES